MSAPTKKPRVFVSYSHDSEEHNERVLSLCDLLVRKGIDCWFDGMVVSPPEGWPRWMKKQIKDADRVLVVCSKNYKARYENEEAFGKGKGAKWEGAIITQKIYDNEVNTKFIPIAITKKDLKYVPDDLEPATYFNVWDPKELEKLYRFITGQPKYVRPEVGEIEQFTPIEVKQFFSLGEPPRPKPGSGTVGAGARKASAEPAGAGESVESELEAPAPSGQHPTANVRPQGPTAAAPPRPPIRIDLSLIHDGIDTVHERDLDPDPIDAIAVGLYLGVRPAGAALALDRAISRGMQGSLSADEELLEQDLLLTQLVERSALRSELGQDFCIPDPRAVPTSPQSKRRRKSTTNRLIVIAGMGLIGRFGAAELTILARELCWLLDRLGRRHLATVLIGTGGGNLTTGEAVAAWFGGLREALLDVTQDEGRHLHRITFVEFDPRKIEEIQSAINQQLRRLSGHVRLEYTSLSAAELERLRQLGQEFERREREEQDRIDRDVAQLPWRVIPTRIMSALERGVLHLGAITDRAVFPDREIRVNSKLIHEAGEDLLRAPDLDDQLERGRFLAQLLLSPDVWSLLAGESPLVIQMDASAARIPWEMIVPPGASLPEAGVEAEAGAAGQFLGTRRGLTRQLRTPFAPPPEASPSPRRILRVLIVADPAADAPLPGAAHEGIEVAELFEAFNVVHAQHTESRIEVVRLIGPREATRTNVLRHLALRSFDVLHMAGHGFYNPEDPLASGWVFTGGDLLTPAELSRVDRLPRLIFSNTPEAGVTPDRVEEHSEEYAPSLAEAFIALGIPNLIALAWPVDDAAIRLFALSLYSGLLGLGREGDQYVSADIIPMYEAVRRARLAVASLSSGQRSWGAFQHYGNPFLHFFAKASI